MEEEELLLPVQRPRLRHEMSLMYHYAEDRENVCVPLRFRLKYDEVLEYFKSVSKFRQKYDKVIDNLKEKMGIQKFEYLLQGEE